MLAAWPVQPQNGKLSVHQSDPSAKQPSTESISSVLAGCGSLLVKLSAKDTQILLAAFVQDHSDSAFRELVARYIDLVYSTALRLVHGDRHLAQDVAQIVFVDLACKARKLPPTSCSEAGSTSTPVLLQAPSCAVSGGANCVKNRQSK